jgi:hypothetical protein
LPENEALFHPPDKSLVRVLASFGKIREQTELADDRFEARAAPIHFSKQGPLRVVRSQPTIKEAVLPEWQLSGQG